jgi:hypothetical protein
MDGPAAQPPLDRGPEPVNRLAVERVAFARADRQQPAGGQVTGRSQGGVVALPGQLAKAGQGCQLAAAPTVELSQNAVEGGLTDDRHGQHVGRDLPGLIRNDPKLHARSNLPGRGPTFESGFW